jgi:hypothetical protein
MKRCLIMFLALAVLALPWIAQRAEEYRVDSGTSPTGPHLMVSRSPSLLITESII